MLDLIVLVLIFSPWEVPATEWCRVLLPALKRVNITLQIAGPHERYGEVVHELAYSRRFLREHWDAPRIEDCLRLPSHVEAVAAWQASDRLRGNLECRRMVDRHWWEWIDAAIAATQVSGDVWHEVAMATRPDASWAGRRQALARLRNLIGPAAYYSGRLPAPLPLWTLAERP